MVRGKESREEASMTLERVFPADGQSGWLTEMEKQVALQLVRDRRAFDRKQIRHPFGSPVVIGLR
jgi:hypothetical protein